MFRKAGSGWLELRWCGWRKDVVGYLYGNSREHHARCIPCEWRVQRAQLYMKFILTLCILWMGLGSPPQGSTGHSLRNTHPGEQDHRQLGKTQPQKRDPGSQHLTEIAESPDFKSPWGLDNECFRGRSELTANHQSPPPPSCPWPNPVPFMKF